MKSAVLFIVFNRKEITEQSFEIIRKAKPPRLYIAADGPRNHVDGEREICEEVRKIATNVDWDCEVKTFFQDKNLKVNNNQMMHLQKKQYNCFHNLFQNYSIIIIFLYLKFYSIFSLDDSFF